eukprot:TRINITY_DN7193_c0_g1_i1.p1 TRINITY_DN7193_c0_g1~~TRINITY_DN7193_c0_g1_i1.p1  ORF type:complete len:403 (+),score=78.67 TRINITY_DN7193_c0_g1_i1:1143-2351(+)
MGQSSEISHLQSDFAHLIAMIMNGEPSPHVMFPVFQVQSDVEARILWLHIVNRKRSAIMTKEITFDVFGIFAWPIVAILVVAQLWFAFFTPLDIGKYLLDSVVWLCSVSQATMPYLGLGSFAEKDGDKIHAMTCIPLSIYAVVVLYLVKLIVAKLVQARLPYGDDAVKFGECFVRATYYMMGFLMCWHIVATEDYWPNTWNCWHGVYTTQTRSLQEEAYYVIELAFYIGGVFVHVFIDKPLKDFYVMLFHHIITICLILFSYLMGHHRIGILVLLCHDVSDVFLDYAKCLHYLDFDILSTVTFVNLLVSWCYYRLYLFPFVVIKSAMFESAAVVEQEGTGPVKYHAMFVAFLCMLQVLHVYWFYLMVKIAARKLTDGDLEDNRDEEAVKRQIAARQKAVKTD